MNKPLRLPECDLFSLDDGEDGDGEAKWLSCRTPQGWVVLCEIPNGKDTYRGVKAVVCLLNQLLAERAKEQGQ